MRDGLCHHLSCCIAFYLRCLQHLVEALLLHFDISIDWFLSPAVSGCAVNKLCFGIYQALVRHSSEKAREFAAFRGN